MQMCDEGSQIACYLQYNRNNKRINGRIAKKTPLLLPRFVVIITIGVRVRLLNRCV